MAEEEVQAFAVEDDRDTWIGSGYTLMRRSTQASQRTSHFFFVEVDPDPEVDSCVVLQSRVSAALAWCFQSLQTWVQELEMDKPQQVNLNCLETPCMSSPVTCCHRHHHCTRVQTQKGLTDRQLSLDSVCCGAVPF